MNDKAALFVDSRCELGEGPFWHPLLKRLFWFDILNQTLLSATTDGHLVDRITFKDFASAAAVVDANTLAVVQSNALLRYDFSTDTSTVVGEIEDNPANRSNDSRMDRSGGFWISSMNRAGGAPRPGSVYQWKAAKITTILTGIAVPNSICFSPDGARAYFTDAGAVIRTVTLDSSTGLPNAEWTDFFSGKAPGGADGSVVDSEGFVWNARWGGSCVIRFSPDGKIDRIIDVPGVSRVSCPAFGGDDMKTLYLTTARENMTPEELEREPTAGSVYSIRVDVPGIAEPFLKL